MSRAGEWMNSAPPRLLDLIRRMTWHRDVRWEAADYVEDGEFGPDGDGRQPAETLEQAEAVSSLLRPNTFLPDRRHALAIDIDVPAWLIPSSTEGHSHLYVDLVVPEDDLWAFLDAAARIGLVEEGYVRACRSRGMTSLRAPWVRKGQERSAA